MVSQASSSHMTRFLFCPQLSDHPLACIVREEAFEEDRQGKLGYSLGQLLRGPVGSLVDGLLGTGKVERLDSSGGLRVCVEAMRGRER